ncbi:hypothetical protein ACOSQ2_018547 [Xanthoceras sorbifolium]
MKTLRDFYKRSNTHIDMKEALGPKKHPKKDRSRSPRDRSKRKDGERGDGHNRNRDLFRDDASANRVAKKARNDKDVQQGRGHYQTYAQLSDSRDKIFSTERNKEEFGRPPPMRTPTMTRNLSKF